MMTETEAKIRAAYMQTAAIDLGTAIIAGAIESVATAFDNIEKGGGRAVGTARPGRHVASAANK
jgi:hypothetical protein